MIEARDIHLSLGGRPVLHGVSLTLHPGEVLGLIGPNGAGKSTLLACISGARRPDRGEVRIDGVVPASESAARLARRRAVLEQTPISAAAFTLTELALLAVPRELSPREAAEIAHRALSAVGLAPMAGRGIDQLSGGERHRGHMARALAQHLAARALGEGGWLLLDEPTASLDLRHQGSVLRAARAAAAGGAGVLAVLHDLTLAAAMSDRLAIISEGRIVAVGLPEEVLTSERLEAIYGLPVAISQAGGGHPAITPIYRTREGDIPCLSL